ncbi:MAG: hypothetical protein R2874_03435 [Desulfobacterales bacterium]
MNLPDQRALFRQMENPEFYPHAASPVTSVETHISKVFLAGDRVYKIKKPLNLGFLDFTTLEKRKYFCHREVVPKPTPGPECIWMWRPLPARVARTGWAEKARQWNMR